MIRIFIYYFFIASVLIAVLPLYMFLCALIVVFSGLPILYRQRRIGEDNIPFVFYKFRIMKKGADEWQGQYKHLNEADGPVFKIHDDSRFTNIGNFLSHTVFTEFPLPYECY